MVVFPAIAALVSAIFAVALFAQFAGRRRLAQLAWGIALAQFAVASVAVAAGITGGWDPTLYRVFWLFGALLNVPWLALGSVALLGGRVRTWSASAVVGALTVYASIAVARAALDHSVLAATDGIPRGRDVWVADPQMTTLARSYSIVAWIIVVLIAARTSLPRRGLRPPAGRVRANWLIAVGTSIVAIGGFALGRIGRGSAFSITLALGVLVMFAGFLLAVRAPRYRIQEPGSSPT